jgi:hypothetical protein
MRHRFEILCVSAEQEQISLSPVLSDSLSLTFSPQIPPPTPILDPLQYLRKAFPKVEDESSHTLQIKNFSPECLPAQYSQVGPRQQVHGNSQQCSHASSTSTSLEPYSTLPLLSPHILSTITLDPIAPDKMYKVSY